MSPAAHALDRRIYELRSAREAVVASMAALQADGTWSLLTAGLAGDSLTGETASRTRSAVARVTEVQQGLELVARLVDHVVALRDAGPSDERRTTELVALLNSPAILVPADVPWMEHVLPPPPEDRAVTAQTLLDEMDGALEPVRRVVAEVDAAWQAFLPRLERVSTAADAALAEAPGNRALSDVRARLAALSDQVVDDPIGALSLLGSVEADLTAAAGLRSEVSRLQSSLETARELLATIESTIEAGARALGRARAEIASPSGLLDPLDPSAIGGEQGLRPWIVRLERLVAQGDVARASQGLARWNDLAASTLAAAEQVESANSAPLAARSSLGGLLRAARVKAGAAGRAEDPVLGALAEAAERALAVPADLDAAQAHVDAYLEELRRPGARAPVARPARGSAARSVASGVPSVDPWAGVPLGGAAGAESAAPSPHTASSPGAPTPAVGSPPDPAVDPAVGSPPDPAVDPAVGSPPDPAVDPWAGVAAGTDSAPARRRTDLDQRTGDAPGGPPEAGAPPALDPISPPAAGTVAGPDDGDATAGSEPSRATGAAAAPPSTDSEGSHAGTTSPGPATAARAGTSVRGPDPGPPPATDRHRPRAGAGSPVPTTSPLAGAAAQGTGAAPGGEPGDDADRNPEAEADTAPATDAPRPRSDSSVSGLPSGASGTTSPWPAPSPSAGMAEPRPDRSVTPPTASPGTGGGEPTPGRPETDAPGPQAAGRATSGLMGTGNLDADPDGEAGDDAARHRETDAVTTAPGAAVRPQADTASRAGPAGPGAASPADSEGSGATTGSDRADNPTTPRAGTGAQGAGGGAGASGGAGRWERPAEPPRRDPADEAGMDVWKEMSA